METTILWKLQFYGNYNFLATTLQFYGNYNFPATNVQFYGNYGFAIIFLMDVLVKLFAYGLINFFKDYFNIFDLVIVALSCYDTFSPGEANGYSVFRAFRLVSIFRVFRSLTGLRKLLEAILNSIPSVSNLGVLILLWLFIYSLLGK